MDLLKNDDLTEQSFKLNQLTIHTISGYDLRAREHNMIALEVKFQPDEKIEMLYMEGGEFEKYFTLENNILVGITNKRIFKCENGGVSFSFLDDIESCSHQKNGIFRWDKVIAKLKNGKEETFGIKLSSTTTYFVNYINTKLTNK